MAGYWLKLYTEILDDPKYYRLSGDAKLGMYELMLVAKKIDKNGMLPSIDDICFYTRRDADWWIPVIDELKRIKFITDTDEGNEVIRKFEDRQRALPGPERAKLARTIKNASKIEPKYKPDKYDALCNPLPNTAGVYFINFPDKKIGYIGASKNIQSRVRAHMTEISDSRHPLYGAYADYGLEGLRVEVLAETDDLSKLAGLEIEFIKDYSKNYELINTDGYKPNRHWNKPYESYEKAYESYEKAYESYGDKSKREIKRQIKSTERETETENRGEEHALSPVQQMIESVVGLSPGNSSDLKALDEITLLNPTQADIQEAYNWLTGQGKRVRYYSSLVGPVRTALAKRVQMPMSTPLERSKAAVLQVLEESGGDDG